jgi:hypothetical protein
VVMLVQLHLCHLVIVYHRGYCSLLVWRIGIWGDKIETMFDVIPTVQGFVRCNARNLWFVIIPKSKDRFME